MPDSPEPQALLRPLTEAAIFLVATVADGAEDDVRDLLSDVGRSDFGSPTGI
jgi:putative iron-dependent peroxidase